MKWAWVFVLPWAVELSSSYLTGAGKYVPPYARHQDGAGAITCNSVEACLDLVEALNQAHERRTRANTPRNEIPGFRTEPIYLPSTTPANKGGL